MWREIASISVAGKNMWREITSTKYNDVLTALFLFYFVQPLDLLGTMLRILHHLCIKCFRKLEQRSIFHVFHELDN